MKARAFTRTTAAILISAILFAFTQRAEAQCNCDIVIDSTTTEVDGTTWGTPTSDSIICLQGHTRGTLKLKNLQGDSNAKYVVIPEEPEITIRPDSSGYVEYYLLSDTINIWNSLQIYNSSFLSFGNYNCGEIHLDTHSVHFSTGIHDVNNRVHIDSSFYIFFGGVKFENALIGEKKASQINGGRIYTSGIHFSYSEFNNSRIRLLDSMIVYFHGNTINNSSTHIEELNHGVFDSNYIYFDSINFETSDFIILNYDKSILCRKNIFRCDSIQDFDIGFYAAKLDFINNLIDGPRIHIFSSDTAGYVSLLSNTFITSMDYNLLFQTGNPFENNQFHNNLFYNSNDTSDHLMKYYPHIVAEPSIFHQSYNVYSKNLNQLHFKNPANHDYRLGDSSIAIDAGNDTSYTETDLAGNPRVLSKRIDCGAYEWYPEHPGAAYRNVPLKALYVTMLDTIIANYDDAGYFYGSQYETLLDLVKDYKFNHIIFYRLNNLEQAGFGIDQGGNGTEGMSELIHELKTEYGVISVAGYGSQEPAFQRLADYNQLVNNEWSRRFDFINVEFEYWNSSVCNPPCMGDYIDRLSQARTIADEPQNDLLVETYIGNIDEEDAQDFAEYVDRILLAHYRDWIASDYSNSSIFRTRVYRYEDIYFGDSTTAVMPLFNCRDTVIYANGDTVRFLQDTLTKNGVTEALVYEVWKSGVNDIDPDNEIICYYDDIVSCADVKPAQYAEVIDESKVHALPLAGYAWYRDQCLRSLCQEVYVLKNLNDSEVREHMTHCLTAEAIGQSLSCQWYYDDGVNPPSAVTGATEKTLCLKDFQSGDVGFYFCEVSSPVSSDCMNNGSTDTTNSAYLSIGYYKRGASINDEAEEEGEPDGNSPEERIAGEPALYDLKVYPNPSRDGFVTIESSRPEGAEVIVTNLNGSDVFTGRITSGMNSVDLSDLAKGMYFVRIHFNDSSDVVKLVLQ